MTHIDFLASQGEDRGARPGGRGFVVAIPWGEYHLGEVELAEGWYSFQSDSNGAVLVLDDVVRFTLIELQADRQSPAYVRLSAGRYRLSLLPGARPGFHPAAAMYFRTLSAWQHGRLLFGRLLQALRNGVSPATLWVLVRLALSRRTYGLRAAGTAAGADLGKLSLADRGRDLADVALGDYARRLAHLDDGPRFWVCGPHGEVPAALAVGEQVYRRFTVTPGEAHDFVVVVGAGDVLTPDALLVLAEHIVGRPDSAVVLADTWILGRPTARVAWDPLLYAGGLPTPFAHARETAPVATFANGAAFSLVPIPLAISDAPAGFSGDPADVAADGPPCTIIIPTRDRADLLSACLEGLFDKTAWPHEVIVVDNGSSEPETFALFDRYSQRGLKIIRADIPFNFSTLCNIGAAEAAYDYLLFLNNDVVLHRPDWLARMMALAVLPQAGAVGARLLYADGRLQHGGVMLGLSQLCGHLWRGLARDLQDAEPRLAHSSLRRAVTAACLCVSRARFDAVGGFDAERFPVTLNDIDLCLKLEAAGGVNIYCATAEAYHLEGESRGADDDLAKAARRHTELLAFSRTWRGEDGQIGDPWLPPSLSRAGERGAPR